MSLVKRSILFFILLCCLSVSLFALDLQPVITSPQIQVDKTVQVDQYSSAYVSQLGGSSVSEGVDSVELRLLRALSSPNYPVVSGDQYSLSYLENGKMINLMIVVPYSKQINLGTFGIIDASEMTYLELKAAVENKISSLYQYGNPQFTITNTGIFPVTVKGEVVKTTVVDAWGLSKLSDVLSLALDTASTRSVIITRGGEDTTYDLYLGLMEGVDEQNPTLKVGDVVTFVKKSKMVEISGFVNRPGFYQVGEKEYLLSIINRYAKGFSPSASLENVNLLRNVGNQIDSREINLNTKALYYVEDGDKIVVKQNLVEYPSISLEGALSPSQTSANYIQGAYSSKYFYKFMPGETIAEMAESISYLFSSYSDLKEAVLIRDEVEEKIDLEAILYQNDAKGKDVLCSGDKIYIPFSQMLVTVNGAVNKAGNFGYVPGKTLSYYINLAGGLTSNAKSMDKIKVYDKFGDEIDKDGIIPSESTITVPQNTFSTNIAPIVATVGLVSSVLGIVYTITQIVNNVSK